jgi:hypothetical protein
MSVIHAQQDCLVVSRQCHRPSFDSSTNCCQRCYHRFIVLATPAYLPKAEILSNALIALFQLCDVTWLDLICMLVELVFQLVNTYLHY